MAMRGDAWAGAWAAVPGAMERGKGAAGDLGAGWSMRAAATRALQRPLRERAPVPERIPGPLTTRQSGPVHRLAGHHFDAGSQ